MAKNSIKTKRKQMTKDDRKEGSEMAKLSTSLEFIQKDIGEIKADVKDIKSNYVSQNEFKGVVISLSDFVKKEDFTPVKSIVYGLVGLILTGVVGALLALILK